MKYRVTFTVYYKIKLCQYWAACLQVSVAWHRLHFIVSFRHDSSSQSHELKWHSCAYLEHNVRKTKARCQTYFYFQLTVEVKIASSFQHFVDQNDLLEIRRTNFTCEFDRCWAYSLPAAWYCCKYYAYLNTVAHSEIELKQNTETSWNIFRLFQPHWHIFNMGINSLC